LVWRIEFESGAEQDLRKIDRTAARRILSFLHTRIAPLEDPRSTGVVLRRVSGPRFWRYRVGDYRIIARIEDDVLRIMVIRVAHRREAYRRLPSA
jgi:mRNA interferase RelE/StbE